MNTDQNVGAKITQLDSAREHALHQEKRRALRTLLQHPIITADGPFSEEFGLVRRHSDALRDWLATNTGWVLYVTSELARLRKTPGDLADSTFSAIEERSSVPFSRRRYVLFCLALATLQRSDRQTTLTALADSIVESCLADPRFSANGIVFDLGDQNQRRDLVAVVRFIIAHQVLRRVHGDEEGYLRDEHNNVLYSINTPVLSAMICVQRGPSTVTAVSLAERIESITSELAPDTKDGINRQIRWKLTRRLLEKAVLYYDDLSEAERAYLESQRWHILNNIEEATGLKQEVRREGIAMLDETGDLNDGQLSEEGTEGHLTFLLAEFLASQARENRQGLVGILAIQAHTASLILEHRRHWKREASDPGAECLLSEMALCRLGAMNLIRRLPDGVLPLPAIARFAVAQTASPEAQEVNVLI
jgi:uncharacterized protein (TIGR02678 family)